MTEKEEWVEPSANILDRAKSRLFYCVSDFLRVWLREIDAGERTKHLLKAKSLLNMAFDLWENSFCPDAQITLMLYDCLDYNEEILGSNTNVIDLLLNYIEGMYPPFVITHTRADAEHLCKRLIEMGMVLVGNRSDEELLSMERAQEIIAGTDFMVNSAISKGLTSVPILRLESGVHFNSRFKASLGYLWIVSYYKNKGFEVIGYTDKEDGLTYIRLEWKEGRTADANDNAV